MSTPTSAPTRSPARARLETQPAGPRVDWVLLGAVVGLLALGTLLVWSATAHRAAPRSTPPLS
ncbi:MAG: hypothetical protein R2731_12955 [Nocardioides sp.]